MDTNIANNEIILGLDQNLPMERAQEDILERVDKILQEAIDAGNPDIAANAMKSLIGVSRISGLAMAKFCYTFQFQWDNFNRNDSFVDYMEEYLGRGKTTIKRYVRVWEMLVSGDIPREYCEKLKLQSIKSLVPMANLFASGFDVSTAQWGKLANAPDVTTVNKLVREIKGTPPRKNSLQLEMDTDGSIYAWKDGKKEFVGSLNVDDKSPIVQAAIARIMGDKILEK